MKPSISFPLLILLTAFSIVVSSESSVELTYDNFDEKTKGKTVFIKFFSPSCGHCQALAPKWEKMAKEWVNHEQGLVGSVDCSVEEKFCAELKVLGLPTLLYGEPAAQGVLMLEYEGDRSEYKPLAEFAKKTLSKPMCSPVNLDACEEKERHQLMYFLSLGEFELDSVIKYKDEAIQLAKDQFEARFEEMQSAYDHEGTEHELRKARIQSRIKLLKSILDMKKTTA